MAGDEFGPHRRDCLKGVSGDVLEIGFGSGLNLPYYPSEVKKLYALDPAKLGRMLAAGRLAECPFPVEFVEFVDLQGESIPLAADSVDAAVCTWTLCTIPEPGQALREIGRVLKPGGQFHFVEHGRSSDLDVARWQDRLTPFHRLYSGGCHLNRKIDAIIQGAGFELERMKNVYMKGPRVGSYLYKGLAVTRL
jgi:ubiquinone/menaquinone biosynthesis C-methylase UbiE